MPNSPGRVPTKFFRIALVLLFATLAPALVSAADKPGDDDIALAVTQRLLNDPGARNFVIDVEVEQGVVSLTGSVTNLMAKERARRLAETVKGVRAIVNRIDVSPRFRPDDELRQDVEQALAVDPATDVYEVEVDVDRQKVILTGSVDSWAEKRLAGRVAKRVNGVKALENRVAVDLELNRPDDELEREIEQILAWDALVDDDQITVEVTDGNVRLGGYVASLAEKRRAANQAWVPGVDGVDETGLEVTTWARDPRFRKQKYAKLDKPDPAVAEAVRAALRRDPRVPADLIKVEVDNGKAVLTGKVDNLLSKRAAGRTAGNTLGVYRVKNHLQVRPGTPTDEVLDDRVTAAIARNPVLENEEIGVQVIDGVVGLEGSVDSYYEKAVADNTAASVYGVVYVDNDLFVEDKAGAPLSYSPYVDDWTTRDYDWYRGPEGFTATAKDDWEILEDVRDELFWSPFVDSDEVEVSVDNGVVTLSGTVDSWSERQTAAENAYEGGAAYVDNDLRVRYGPDFYAPEG